MSGISSQIVQHEQKARKSHLSAVKQIGNVPVPACFNDFLEESILPSLVQSGFERDIAENIFRISASAWKLMGLATDPKIRFHPALVRHIQEIHQDIISNPRIWIIHPRAHSFLTKGDSLCLLVYLQHLGKITNPVLKKILARLLIEFIGNYSLKFIDSALPEKQVIDAVYYGYVAMFWKNLRQPPPGQEDLLIFRNFLSWVKTYQKKLARKEPEKEAVIAEMEKIADRILPDRNTCISFPGKDPEADSLHITLRHGRPGINYAVQHFSMTKFSLCHNAHDLLSYRMLPKQINTLFRELRHSYPLETPRTRVFIQAFLTELKTAYSPHPVRPNLTRQTPQYNLDFTYNRIACMVQDFSRSLH